MKPIPPLGANHRFKLDGTDDRDVQARVGPGAGADGIVQAGDPCYHMPYVLTTWEPAPDERAAIATGGLVELVIMGRGFPPMSMAVAKPPELAEGFIWIALPPDIAHDLDAMLGALEGADPGTDDGRQRLANLKRFRDTLAESLRTLEPPEPPPSA